MEKCFIVPVQGVLQYIKGLFTLDKRSLAIMRILIALVVIVDLSIRVSDLHAFYTDAGIVSRSLLQYSEYGYTNPYFFSLLNISGHWFPVLLLFIATMVCALHLLVGYRTRWFTFLTWLLLLSIQTRNPFIVQGGDGYLRLILFWGMFLPWGERFSVDAMKLNGDAENKHFSLAGIAYILQVISLYLFTALLKNGDEWTSSFTALYYALSLDQLVKPIGKLLLPHSELLEFLTKTTISVEFLIPLLLLIPYKKYFFRGIVLVLLLGLHLSIELMMQVGLFSFISLAAASGLTPPSWIEWLKKKLKISGKVKFFFSAYRSKMDKAPKLRLSWTFLTTGVAKWTKTSIVGLALIIGIIWNISTLYDLPPQVSKVVDPIGAFARLDQHWGMFAPVVFKDDGWFIKEGHRGKDVIDLYTYPDSVTYKKPKLAVRQFKNARWRKFGENIIFVDNIPVRNAYCEYELQKWNKSHPSQKLDSLILLYMMEPTLPDYQTPEISREELCTCYSEAQE